VEEGGNAAAGEGENWDRQAVDHMLAEKAEAMDVDAVASDVAKQSGAEASSNQLQNPSREERSFQQRLVDNQMAQDAAEVMMPSQTQPDGRANVTLIVIMRKIQLIPFQSSR
jgi:uncharacterized membrane-anchored protein YhcB (DUF1043 family)